MKKKLKELIENAKPRLAGRYDMFLIVNEQKPYNGFYGNTGYNFMTILGYDETTKEWYRVSEHYSDVLNSFDKMSWNIDIPNAYGCVRIWFDYPVYINTDVKLSSVRLDAQPATESFADWVRKGYAEHL